MIEASCGHVLTPQEFSHNIVLKYLDDKGNRILRRETVCTLCKNRYVNDTTLVLRTKTEQKMWLAGKLKV